MKYKISFSQELMVKGVLKITFIILILFVIAYLTLDWSIGKIIEQKSWADPKIVAFTILLLGGYFMLLIEFSFLNKLGDYIDNVIDVIKKAVKGNDGEKRTIKKLGEILGIQYQLYPNFKIPNEKFDIDVLIVGPKGLMNLEIKNMSGEFQFIKEKTYKIFRYYDGNVCHLELGDYKNPIREVLRHNSKLKNWLEKNGYQDIKINNAIVMVGNSNITKIEEPKVYIITDLNRINQYDYFNKSSGDVVFTNDECVKMNNFLRQKINQTISN